MQRCIFFIVFAAYSWLGFSQPLDVERYTLDIYTAALNAKTVSARVQLDIASTNEDELILYCPKPLQINQVMWKEGRVKGFLSFREKDNKLFIKLPPARAIKPVSLLIEYTIQLDMEGLQAFKLQKNNVMAFNPTGLYRKRALLPPAVFFPSKPNDSAFFSINVSYEAGYRTKSNGSISFQTKSNRKVIADFWDTEKPILPGEFYLLVGSFEHTEPEKLNAELGLTEQSEKFWKAEFCANNLEHISPFLKREFNTILKEEEFLAIDSLSKLTQPSFFVREGDWTGTLDDSEYLYGKTALLWQFNFDSTQADEAYTRFFIQEKGEQNFSNMLLTRWQKTAQPDPLLLKYGLRAYRKNEPDFNPVDVQLFADALDTGNIPALKVHYMYKGEWQQQLLIVEQDTNLAQAYHIPLNVSINLKDSTLIVKAQKIKPNAIDTVRIPLNSAPQSISLEFGTFFPGSVDDQKPDYYALYDLNNASDFEQREAALNHLFKTTNQNLFSTVIGIALRDEDVKIRAHALQEAETLNPVGAYKIKGTLEQMMQSEPAPELQETATLVYQKLFNPK